MQEILDRYGHNDSPYLFPIIRDTAKDAVRQYRSAAHFINGKLKELGKRLGLGMPLTMYERAMPGRVLPEARMCRWQPSARRWDMIRKTRPESTSPRWIPHKWTRQTTSYSNPYNGDGCGTQNTGQRLCRSCFSWQEKYYNVQSYVKY